MEQSGASSEAFRKATAHLQQLLLKTPGKTQQHAANEAKAIACLALEEGNPVRELFMTAVPRLEQERPRSPSPTGTIRPRSSKGGIFGKLRGRDKSTTVSASSSAQPKATQVDGITPDFALILGPLESAKSKRKARAIDPSPPASSSSGSKSLTATSSSSSQQRQPMRKYEHYKCIVCDQELSSKGVCKRHLVEQHISPSVYECERCHAYYDVKSDAKKHCSQCGDGEGDFRQATLPSKTLYACEFTGAYFLGQSRFVEHLLALSEKTEHRPKPDLDQKLAAILRHWGYRPATQVGHHCRQISRDYFGRPDAWEHLQYEGDFLRSRIKILEHATFHDDGTVESARWHETGSEQRRDTQQLLLEILSSGKLQGSAAAIENARQPKPEPMSICTTPMPLVYGAPSIGSGLSNTATPISAASPMPRSQSRQTVWSHDGAQHSTTATTPRTTAGGDEVMTAELKSKRHLSDESRAYLPSRTPPGPPEPPDLYQYQGDSGMHPPQLPPLPTFVTPSGSTAGSTVSLPLRNMEDSNLQPAINYNANVLSHNTFGYPMHHPVSNASQHTLTSDVASETSGYPMHHPVSNASQHTLTSDVASETSTLAQSYREPEFLQQQQHPAADDYLVWRQQQEQAQQQFAAAAYHSNNPQAYGYGSYNDYGMPDDASMVASSVNTGNTMGVEYVAQLPKMEDYSAAADLGQHHHAYAGTFYLPGDEEEQRGQHGMR